jgi:carbamoyl-phosphate synthase small subunit
VSNGLTGQLDTEDRQPALLVLADGEVFEGSAAGDVPESGIATGELVFNTAMAGYQEILTDPSYAGQIVCFTYPHIGNYGVNSADDEARRAFCRGFVVRDLPPRPSNWRASGSLEDMLKVQGIPGITGVDTRRLTRQIRTKGAVPCAFGTASESDLRAAASREPGTTGMDLVSSVSTDEPYVVGNGSLRVVGYDFGVKAMSLRLLGDFATVTVVPSGTSAQEVLAMEPDGVFLSNGP